MVIGKMKYLIGPASVWNVIGLNSGAHRDAVRDLVASECPSLICLQEMKLEIFTDFDMNKILGLGFDYVYLPTCHTHGGILLAWQPDT